MSEDGQPPWDQSRSRDQPDGGSEGKSQRGPEQFLAELDAIAGYLRLAAESGFEQFHDGTAAYACATTAVIRLQSLTERAQYATYFAAVPPVDRAGLSKTRSIAAHAGYVDMDDHRFWKSVTDDMPRLLESLHRAATGDDPATDPE